MHSYRKRGQAPDLKKVLAKLRARNNGETIQYVPASYPDTDIKAARKILDRLSNPPTINEVSYIKVIPRYLEEEDGI